MKDAGLEDEIKVFVYVGTDKDLFKVKGNPKARHAICFVNNHFFVKDDNYRIVTEMILKSECD